MPPSFAGAAIVFDLDGTLVDTAPDLVGTLNELLLAEGAPPLALDVARPLIGGGARRLMARGWAAAGLELDPARMPELYDRFIAAYRARIADHSVPFPGVEEALEELAAGGAKLAVCTNKPTALSLELLSRLGLAARFRAIVGPEFAPAPKPDPRHLLAALERLGARPDRALMVGDSPADAAAARDAGAGLVLVSYGYTETPAADLSPDALVDDFAELPQTCARLLALSGMRRAGIAAGRLAMTPPRPDA
ncbi:MAG TPA: phosphoglycolate phosphatase [Caulobacteraceae bacterium]|nr:phosphoglycolate phosphatase [Caulobacteraceae bacterium]